MHQQLTIEFDAAKRRSVAHVRRSLAKPCSAVSAVSPVTAVGLSLHGQYLRDLERVDPDDCFFSAMGRLAAEGRIE